MIASLIALLILAGPYEDTQHRFSVDLPAKWVFSPVPGDTAGAYFKRTQDGAIANATVRVMKFTQPVDLDTFAARVGDAADHEPGYRLLNNQAVRIGNMPAISRRFVVAINGDLKWTKMVEQRILVVGNMGFVVHVETLADAFPLFQDDFNKILLSFQPGTGKAPSPAQAHRAKPGVLVGKWEGAGHALELSPSGAAILDRSPGSYHVTSGVLILQLGDQQVQFEYELNGDNLRLSGANFAGGQNFHRVR